MITMMEKTVMKRIRILAGIMVWAGLVFGFMRMRLGLAASMLAHAGANLLAIAPTMLGL